MNDLPEGWASCEVQEYFRSFSGGTPDRGTATYWNGKTPWLSSGDIKEDRIHQSSESITKAGLEHSSAKLCRAGSIVVVVRSGILKHTLPVAVLQNEAAINQDLKCFDSGNDELNAWFALALRSAAPDILALNREGTTVQSVKYDTLKEFELRIPPPSEQYRIVEKVGALLAKVAAVQARAETVPTILKRFRRAVLVAACTGRLTAMWRQHTHAGESATEFVYRIQQERKRTDHKGRTARATSTSVPIITEDAAELPRGWCVARIGDVSDCLDHLRIPVNKDGRAARKGQVPYYGANGQVGWIDEFLFDEDLVLVVEDETFIGREKPFSYVIRGKAWVNNHAHVLRPAGGMSVDYLNACLSYYDFTPLTSGTTGRRKLTQEGLRTAPLWIAPLPEQEEIARRVGKLFALADAIEVRYEKAKVQVDKLTQSVLAKAFRGELVPTEAELAQSEGRSYETAEQLLARIQREQQRITKNAPSSRIPPSERRRTTKATR